MLFSPAEVSGVKVAPGLHHRHQGVPVRLLNLGDEDIRLPSGTLLGVDEELAAEDDVVMVRAVQTTLAPGVGDTAVPEAGAPVASGGVRAPAAPGRAGAAATVAVVETTTSGGTRVVTTSGGTRMTATSGSTTTTALEDVRGSPAPESVARREVTGSEAVGDQVEDRKDQEVLPSVDHLQREDREKFRALLQEYSDVFSSSEDDIGNTLVTR